MKAEKNINDSSNRSIYINNSGHSNNVKSSIYVFNKRNAEEEDIIEPLPKKLTGKYILAIIVNALINEFIKNYIV